jgi:ribonuclease H2 subunit B
MTPIDPTFLLIPILQVVQPVRPTSTFFVQLSDVDFFRDVQIDGSPGSFRPADDIFEDAVARLIKAQDAQSTAKDPSSAMCEEDIHHLLDTRCIRVALRRVCDVKGNARHSRIT